MVTGAVEILQEEEEGDEEMKKILLNTGLFILFTLSLTGCYTIMMDSPSEVTDNSTTIIINTPPPPLVPVPYLPNPDPIYIPVKKLPDVPDNNSRKPGIGFSKIRNNGGRASETSRYSNFIGRSNSGRSGSESISNSRSSGRSSSERGGR